MSDELKYKLSLDAQEYLRNIEAATAALAAFQTASAATDPQAFAAAQNTAATAATQMAQEVATASEAVTDAMANIDDVSDDLAADFLRRLEGMGNEATDLADTAHDLADEFQEIAPAANTAGAAVQNMGNQASGAEQSMRRLVSLEYARAITMLGAGIQGLGAGIQGLGASLAETNPKLSENLNLVGEQVSNLGELTSAAAQGAAVGGKLGAVLMVTATSLKQIGSAAVEWYKISRQISQSNEQAAAAMENFQATLLERRAARQAKADELAKQRQIAAWNEELAAQNEYHEARIAREKEANLRQEQARAESQARILAAEERYYAVTLDREANLRRQLADLDASEEQMRDSPQIIDPAITAEFAARRAELQAQLNALLEREQDITAASAASAQKRADAEAATAARLAERQATAAEDLETSLAILRARVAGDDALVETLTREAAIRRESLRIQRDLGLAEADALALAREKVDLEARAKDAQSSDAGRTARRGLAGVEESAGLRFARLSEADRRKTPDLASFLARDNTTALALAGAAAADATPGSPDAGTHTRLEKIDARLATLEKIESRLADLGLAS